MSIQTREVHLVRRPDGIPAPSDFAIVPVTLPALKESEICVRNKFMSLEPYMRLLMDEEEFHAPPYQLGQALHGRAVGEVLESRDPALNPGDLVMSNFGWREAFVASGADVTKVSVNPALGAQSVLSGAGVRGLTAYAGLVRIAALKPGDVVFVSAAAGTVGMVACQIAKLKGHRVIGSAGGGAKVQFLRDLGVDHVIDYKSEPDLAAAIRRAAPDGFDVYFDNVGGEHLDAAFLTAARYARFALCGTIAGYNRKEETPLYHSNLTIVKSLRLEGYVAWDHLDLLDEFNDELARWVADGKFTTKETIASGLENAPATFAKLFTGETVGATMVQL